MSDTIILSVNDEPIGVVESPPAELKHEIQIFGENGLLKTDSDERVTAELIKDRPRYVD